MYLKVSKCVFSFTLVRCLDFDKKNLGMKSVETAVGYDHIIGTQYLICVGFNS